jgi:hypothetical protein
MFRQIIGDVSNNSLDTSVAAKYVGATAIDVYVHDVEIRLVKIYRVNANMLVFHLI